VGKELASVIIPVRDGGRFLAQAMESILAQTHERLELIVIDDGSTDDSPVVAGGYAARDPRVRFEYSRGRGIVEALETGLSLASGQWVARMDCDDIALPQRLEVQLAWMQRNGVDVCGSLVETFGAEQRLYWFPESHEAICRELVFRCALMHPSVVMRKAVLESEP
jgi:glycosyltransferase involved in cell wall biosynthesis